MKPLTFLLALSLSGTAALAQSVDMNSLMPTLTFPGGTQDKETVTRKQMPLSN